MSGVRFDFTNKLALVPAVRPVSLSAGTLLSAAIDLNDYVGDIGMEVVVGALTGTLDAKATESDASGGTYTDVVGAAITQITTANAQQMLRVLRTKRFLKISTTVVTGPVLASVNLLGFKKAQ